RHLVWDRGLYHCTTTPRVVSDSAHQIWRVSVRACLVNEETVRSTPSPAAPIARASHKEGGKWCQTLSMMCSSRKDDDG
ncbi:MAG: hypothetical protein ACPIOQ_61960, partial [Promethearchaeia archaeon]